MTIENQGPAPEAARGLREQYRDGRNLSARIALHRRFSTTPYGWSRWVLDQLALPDGARVLELGCGMGTLWSASVGRVSSWRLVLSDFSFGMLHEARERLASLTSGTVFAQADAQTLPFGAASFDAVIANHMLYHVPDRDRAIFEIHRVLRPGGIACLGTNGRAHMRELDEIVERFLPGRGIAGHIDRFGLESGLSYLGRCFASVEVRRYADALIVRESAPLIDYVASVHRGVTREGLDALRRFLDAELSARGAVRITKDAGLFLARHA